MKPEAYNCIVGLGLALSILDALRQLHDAGIEATNRSVTEAIVERYQVPERLRKGLRKRVADQMVTLELQGRIQREEYREAGSNIFSKKITLRCSET